LNPAKKVYNLGYLYMSYQPFVIQDINNGILSAVKAMPQKDINSAGDSDFSQSREQYVRAHSNVSQTNEVKIHKKWFGNRDSSSFIERRRYNAIGVGSLNASGQPTAFSQHNDINVTRDALTRVRAGGYVTTPKIRTKPDNNLTPGFPAGPLVRTQNRSVVEVLGDPVHGQYTTMRPKEPINNFIPVLTDTSYYNRYRKYPVSNFQSVLYH
jgi:hypothetical protein